MIREATLTDVDRLVAMGVRFVTSTTYASRIAVNEDRIAAMMRELIASPTGTVFVATRSSGELVGMLGVGTYAHPMSGEPFASELFWWVEPEARGGMTAIRLLRTAERWAADQGATALQMIAPIPRVEELYQALGYERVEVTYQRSLT